MSVTEWGTCKPGLIAGGAGVVGLTYYGRALNCQPYRDGQSMLVSYPQRGAVTRTCTATWQSSDVPRTNEGTYGYDGTDDGADNMTTVAATILAVSTRWVSNAVRQIHQVSFWLSRTGVPVLAGGGTPTMRVRVYADAAGDPGAQVGTSEAHFNCADIPLAPAMAKCTFTFDIPVDIAGGATPYHIVLFANYDVNLNNYISVHWNTVGGGAQRCRVLNAGWGAAAVRNYWCEIIELNFAAEGAGILPAVAHTVLVSDGVMCTNVFQERREFNVDALVRGPIIRPVLVFGAGAFAWANVSIGAIFGDPIIIPTGYQAT